jgi:hypothetical protein
MMTVEACFPRTLHRFYPAMAGTSNFSSNDQRVTVFRFHPAA